MYQITTNGKVYYADTIYPVSVADNGCYILDSTATGGIVAKIYNGEFITDQVFRLRADALNGSEPLCTYEPLSGARALGESENEVGSLTQQLEQTQAETVQCKTALKTLGIETEG